MGEGDTAETDDLARARTEHAGGDAPAGAGAEAQEVPVPGTRIGRFLAGELLGAGGMGVVVSARDPELDREVALKLVRGARPGGEGRARLLREARAMARLRHPNVLTVYEAGAWGEGVFVAMERVSGGTLRELLARAPRRPWSEVLRLFVAAGEGLAAAHDAGLVHRDFKPDNVLVEGERVLVADFGLVGDDAERRSGGSDSGPRSPLLPDEPLEPESSAQLTRVGQVVGTPSYMAPEQHHGDVVDARSDQFGFCVALYEALFGQLPFAGRNRLRVLQAIERGEIREPPADHGVPAWIVAALRRGLSADPTARFPSMRELCAELTAHEGPRLGARSRSIGMAVFALAVVGWAAASSFLDYRLTYTAMAIVDVSCFLLVLVTALFQRHAMSAFNLRVLGAALGVTAAAPVQLYGSHLLGLAEHAAASLHLFTTFAFGVAAAILLDRRLAPCAASYLAGFLITAWRPELFFPVSALTHGFMGIIVVRVLGAPSLRTSA